MPRTAKTPPEKNALELVEEAFHLIRTAPMGTHALYAVGTLPFVLGLLSFLADMSHSAYAAQRTVSSALGLSALYLWMRTFQSLFGRALRAQASGQPPPPFSFRDVLRLYLVQAGTSAYSLAALPLSLLLALPFAWVYAYHHQLATVAEPHDSVSSLQAKAWRMARLWPPQNHLCILVLHTFGLVVFANVAMLMGFAPYLLKTLFGVATAYSASAHWILDTTFISVALALTYLCMNPLIRAVYVLRTFYGDAQTTGRDILADLRAQRISRRLAIALLMALPSAIHTAHALEAVPVQPPANLPAADQRRQLDGQIDELLRRPEFAWRTPRHMVAEEDSGTSFLARTAEKVIRGFRKMARSLANFLDWLFSRRREDPLNPPGGGWDLGWSRALKAVSIILALALAMFCAVLVWKTRRRPKRPDAAAVPMPPDIEDASITADALPEDAWISLAHELQGKGEFCKAARALFLALLARLARLELLAIQKGKSNRDYLNELQRRTRRDAETSRLFSEAVRWFEEAWYGMHEVKPATFNRFAEILDTLEVLHAG